MSFIDTSVVNAAVVSKGAAAVATAQQTIGTTLPTVSKTVSTSVSTTIKGATGNLSTAAILKNGGIVGTVERVALSAAGNFLQSALKSVAGTFGTSKTGLAGGISPILSNIFGNTKVKSASTTTTTISDPVNTNILSQKSPSSKTFKVGSASPGSQEVGISGAISKNGSGADLMKGVGLSTLLGRFDLDSPIEMLSSAIGSQQNGKVGGLFSNLGVTTPDLMGISGPVFNTDLGGYGLPNDNDLKGFLGNTNELSQSMGSQDFSKYFITNPNISLIDNNGEDVPTERSNVDANTANSLLGILRLIGCEITSSEYRSAFERDSLFNLGLSTAALNGMTRELNDLLNCSQITTAGGQRSLTNAFVSTSGTSIGTAKTILDKVDNPTSLNSDYITKTVVTNPRLRSTDVSLANSVFDKMGTSTTKALSVGSASSDAYPVYDASLLSGAQPSFIEGVFGDKTFTNLFNGAELTTRSDGTLAYG